MVYDSYKNIYLFLFIAKLIHFIIEITCRSYTSGGYFGDNICNKWIKVLHHCKSIKIPLVVNWESDSVGFCKLSVPNNNKIRQHMINICKLQLPNNYVRTYVILKYLSQIIHTIKLSYNVCQW